MGCSKKLWVASSSRGGDGKHRGKASSEKKKRVDPNAYWRCGKTGHWAWECPNHKQEKKAKAHLAQADDEDEATILMAMFCALHDIKAEEKEDTTMVEGPGRALKTSTSTNRAPKSTLDMWAPTRSSGGIWILVPATT